MPKVLNLKPIGEKTAHARIAHKGLVYIGRGSPFGRYGTLAESKWHNPFIIGRDASRNDVMTKYRARIAQQPELLAGLPELRGKDLLCRCAPITCHADVLLEMAK